MPPARRPGCSRCWTPISPLTPGGEDRAQLAVTGTYRPPLGRLGAAVDRALLHRVATMTVAALLTELASAISSPATAGQPHLGTVPGPGQ